MSGSAGTKTADMLTCHLFEICRPLPTHHRLERHSKLLNFRPSHMCHILKEPLVECYTLSNLHLCLLAMFQTDLSSVSVLYVPSGASPSTSYGVPLQVICNIFGNGGPQGCRGAPRYGAVISECSLANVLQTLHLMTMSNE